MPTKYIPTLIFNDLNLISAPPANLSIVLLSLPTNHTTKEQHHANNNRYNRTHKNSVAMEHAQIESCLQVFS